MLAISLCSCSAHRASKDDSAKAILTHNITIGESGGFTGYNSGYFIDSTGLVKSFEGIIMPDTLRKAKGKLNAGQIQKVNKLITELLKTKYSEKGNLTSYITLRKDGTTTSYSWPGPSPAGDVPEPVSRFFSEVKSIINSL